MRIVSHQSEAGRGGGRRPPRGRVRVRQRHGVPGALRRFAPAHRGADLRRPATARWCTCSSASARSSAATRRSSRRRPRRPSDDAAARTSCARPRWPPGQAIGYVGAGTVEFVLDAVGPVLLPRGQHPAAGRAPGHRADHRPGPGRGAARGRGRPAAAAGGHRGHASPATPSRPGCTPRTCPAGYLPASGDVHTFDIARPDRGCGSTPASPPAPGSARSTTRCWPRSSAYGPTRDDARRVLAGALARARLHGVVTNRDLLVGDPARAGVRGRGHRHRLPRPGTRRRS